MDTNTIDTNTKLYVRHQEGKDIHLIWLPGFMSTCHSIKVDSIFEFANQNNYSCTSFDYSGHGKSLNHVKECTISLWIDEIQSVFQHYVKGKTILIGSSMGGWLGLNYLLNHQKMKQDSYSIDGLILIAPAVNMTKTIKEKIKNTNYEEELQLKGYFERPSEYISEPFIISKTLLDSGDQWLLPEGELDIDIPVHILHGYKDIDVPITTSHKLAAQLTSAELTTSYIYDGDHRLSRPQDIAILHRVIDNMVNQSQKYQN